MKPNLFLVAAPRSGSTQLASWLDSHVDIDLSSIKEPNFFSAHEFSDEFVQSTHLNDVDPTRYTALNSIKRAHFAIFRRQSHYEGLFKDMTGAFRMEASTTYLSCTSAPKAIFTYNPDAKIILLTRDPLTRALSHYRLAIRTGQTRNRLSRALAEEVAGQTPLPGRYLLRPSLFQDGLDRYKAIFPKNQIMHIRFEDLFHNPDQMISAICDFLQVAPSGVDLGRMARNVSMAPRFPAINHVLWRTGLKTRLRRILPIPLKQRLLKFYLAPKREIPIQKWEIAALKTALDGQI